MKKGKYKAMFLKLGLKKPNTNISKLNLALGPILEIQG
jgi:hypothetical protein